MSKTSLWRLFGAAVLGTALVPATAQDLLPLQVPSVEQLAQFPRMTGFRLSPDGKHLLAIESQGDTRNILVWQTDNLGTKPTVIGSSAMQIQSVSFLKNDLLAVVLRQPYDARLDAVLTKTFIEKLLITDLAGKAWKEPLEAADIGRSDEMKKLLALATPTVKSRLLSDPDHVIVEGDGVGRERDLFRYNVRTGAATRVLRLSERDLDVVVDGKGLPRAKRRTDSDAKGFYIATEFRNVVSGQWEEHFRSYAKDRDVVEIVSMGATPNTVILRTNVGREVSALYEYDIATKAMKTKLFEHRLFEAVGVRTLASDDPKEGDAYDGFTFRGPYGTETHWENPKYEAVVKGMAQYLGIGEVSQSLVEIANGKRFETKAMDGVSITITGFHAGEVPTYLLRVSGMNYPTEHYLLRGQRLSLLAREYPQIDKRALGKTRLVYYSARDGLNIPAFLTVPNPAQCGPGPYATVIHPHGGPWARDDMGYDTSGWVPLLVSRCRVVLQPQYRGSAEWGRTLWMAGDAQWGQKMQDDKDDGVKWLVEQKLADPKRVAMFGFSYGGYAAFAAAVRPNGHYKCAIAGAGVSDIERIWAKFYTNPYFREGQEPTVRGLSPLTQADKIKIPIMVYHGERDQIVPLIQSELFVEKARKSDQPVEYHMLPDYAHGPAWTRDVMTRQLRIIDQYLAKGCGGSGL